MLAQRKEKTDESTLRFQRGIGIMATQIWK